MVLSSDAPTGRLRYRCLEANCGAVIVANNEDELIDLVSRHVGDAHHGVELDEVILANAEPDEDTIPPGPA
jgi:predicted small metal-binding protein